MPDEEEESSKVGSPLSAVRKSERNVDDLIDLAKRRPILCALFIIVTLASLGHWVLGESISKLKADNIKLENELTETKRDRDSKATQLAPFLAVAEKQFKNAPADKRLDLLLDKVTDIQKRLPPDHRFSLPELDQILAELKQSPKLNVHFSLVMEYVEGGDAVKQLRQVFEQAGFSTITSGDMGSGQRGLTLFGKPEILTDEHLINAIKIMFKRFDQPPRLTTNGFLMDAKSDLTISIGPHPLPDPNFTVRSNWRF
jgi:hypothetical protein